MTIIIKVGEIDEDRCGESHPVHLSDLAPKMAQRILLFEDLVHLLRSQAKSCEFYYPNGFECKKPAVYVWCGYEGEEDWRCEKHHGKPSLHMNVEHELDDNQQAILDLLAKAGRGL